LTVSIEGVLDQIADEDGGISEITLLLRPLPALLERLKRLAALRAT